MVHAVLTDVLNVQDVMDQVALQDVLHVHLVMDHVALQDVLHVAADVGERHMHKFAYVDAVL